MTEHWSEWLEWRGGPCPLPPRARIEVEFRNGHRPPSEGGEAMLRWTNLGFPADIIRFRYRASDRLGWLPRGDWTPPGRLWADDCPVRLEWVVDDGVDAYGGYDIPSTWRGVTHVRLVARERKVELPEGFRIDEDGALWSEFGPVLNRRERDRYRPAAIRQAVDAWLREMGGE